MSQENVELAWRGYELFNARDLTAFFDVFDSDLVYRNRTDEPDARVYHGLEDFKGYVSTWLDTFDDLRFEVHEIINLGDCVVVVTDLLGRGRETGADVRGAYVFLWAIREGRAVDIREYGTKEEALEAAGLSEQAMSQENVRVKNDVIRRWFWGFENDTAAFRDTLHPEIEWFPIDENRGRLYGIEAALRNRNEWLETWGEHRFEVDEVAAEGDSFVVLVHITARGRISGAEVDVRFYAHAKLRDDKVVYIYDHEDRAAALEAVGLSE